MITNCGFETGLVVPNISCEIYFVVLIVSGMLSCSIVYRLISIVEIAIVSYCGFSKPIVINRREKYNRGLLRTRSQCSEHQNTICKQSHDHGFDGKETSFLNSPYYTLLKTFSAGIILGVALLHLLDDSFDKLRGLTHKPGLYSAAYYKSIYLFINLLSVVF